MLKGLDPLLSPELLCALAEMGHGDELALVDRNFPAAALNPRVIRLQGAGTDTAARAILSVLPLDRFIDAPLIRMQTGETDGDLPPVQAEFHTLAEEIENRRLTMSALSRFAFYERVRSVFGVVVTGEDRAYGCFLLTKGVVSATDQAARAPIAGNDAIREALVDARPRRPGLGRAVSDESEQSSM